ncbi:class I SAM-dependent methyltransferase [Haloarchaeobius sp. HRN-SO-5]|uniref:class I SAM-dependent methyltransferase n=1 Tax=Haloarchaeobius sp. HRN-SO-5 TaxID=3446118 RepID=UPI003EBF258E
MTDHGRPYFEFQADVGITEHMGGLEATAELLDTCHVREGDLVLDVGSGTGITSCYAAARYGCRVVGLDISDRMVDWASKRAERAGVADEVEFVVGDVDSIPLGDDQFDAVVSESVTAFARDRAGAVGEYVRVTKPGGYVGLNESTWLDDPPRELRDYMARTLGAEFETRTGWTGLLEAAGLDDVTVATYELSPVRQYGHELRRQGITGIATAWWRFLTSFVTDADFRRRIRTFWPGGRTTWRFLFDFFEYQGYGLYVGRKPTSTGTTGRGRVGEVVHHSRGADVGAGARGHA